MGKIAYKLPKYVYLKALAGRKSESWSAELKSGTSKDYPLLKLHFNSQLFGLKLCGNIKALVLQPLPFCVFNHQSEIDSLHLLVVCYSRLDI